MARTKVVIFPWFEQWARGEAGPLLREIAREFARAAKRRTPVKTGKLRRSVESRGNKVFIGTDHWDFIEYGTRPHKIMVNDRVIRHPGHRAFAPMRETLDGFSRAGSGFTRAGFGFTPAGSGFRRIL